MSKLKQEVAAAIVAGDKCCAAVKRAEEAGSETVSLAVAQRLSKSYWLTTNLYLRDRKSKHSVPPGTRDWCVFALRAEIRRMTHEPRGGGLAAVTKILKYGLTLSKSLIN